MVILRVLLLVIPTAIEEPQNNPNKQNFTNTNANSKTKTNTNANRNSNWEDHVQFVIRKTKRIKSITVTLKAKVIVYRKSEIVNCKSQTVNRKQ